jgi:hypothetical protein
MNGFISGIVPALAMFFACCRCKLQEGREVGPVEVLDAGVTQGVFQEGRGSGPSLYFDFRLELQIFQQPMHPVIRARQTPHLEGRAQDAAAACGRSDPELSAAGGLDGRDKHGRHGIDCSHGPTL